MTSKVKPGTKNQCRPQKEKEKEAESCPALRAADSVREFFYSRSSSILLSENGFVFRANTSPLQVFIAKKWVNIDFQSMICGFTFNVYLDY